MPMRLVERLLEPAISHAGACAMAFVLGAASYIQTELAADTLTIVDILSSLALALMGAVANVLGQMIIAEEIGKKLSRLRVYFSLLTGTVFGGLLGVVALAVLSVWMPELSHAKVPQWSAPVIGGLIWPFIAEKILRMGIAASRGRGVPR